MTLYVVQHENGSVGELTKKMLGREMLLRLHSFDKLGAMKDRDFKPVFAMWSNCRRICVSVCHGNQIRFNYSI